VQIRTTTRATKENKRNKKGAEGDGMSCLTHTHKKRGVESVFHCIENTGSGSKRGKKMKQKNKVKQEKEAYVGNTAAIHAYTTLFLLLFACPLIVLVEKRKEEKREEKEVHDK
jgi:ABC-type dipeptide/oligopeptide/nickel transport system permease component